MNAVGQAWKESLEEGSATYSLMVNGQLHVVENVPARVNPDTGEQLFAPASVEQSQRLIWEHKQPVRIMQVPVSKYA